MPWFSYHGGHSGEFCRHAKGDLASVVARAVEAGFSHYGLSEHVPRYRQEDLFPDEQDLTPADLERSFEAYVTRARALRDQYSEQIELLVGFETERLPPGDWAQRMLGVRERWGFEYMIGSVHDVEGLVVDFKAEQTKAIAERFGGPEELQMRYFAALRELVSTLRPEIVGHVDLIRKFDGPAAAFSARVWPHIEATLEAVRKSGALLEVNAATHRRGLGPVYPLPEILALAQRMGIGVTLGDDSHGAHDVGVGLDACMRAIAAAGYREVGYLAREAGVVGSVSARFAKLQDVHPR